MKNKILFLNVIFLIYAAALTASGQISVDDTLPDGAIARFSPGASVYTVAFSPDGQLLASGGDNNAVILWNVADGSEREVFTEHGKSVMSVAFSSDGQLLASASLDGFVRLWPVFSERKRTSLKHSGWVESVAFSPDGKTLASGGGDEEGFVTLWDVLHNRRINTLSGHRGIVESVAFSPDGQLLASASRDKTIKLWDIDGQHVRNVPTEHSSVVHAVAFSPDGDTLASSSRDKTIKLFEVSSGKNFATFEIRNNLYVYAEAIAFSPDGQFLASACVDYTVRLWDVGSHREVATLPGHHGGVTSVAFSPDRRTLASGSRDRTVLLWDLSYFGIEMPPIADVPENEDAPEVEVPENSSVVDLPEVPESPLSESGSLSDRQDTSPPDIVIPSPVERIVDSTVRQIPVKVKVSDDSRIVEVWVNDREASVLEVGVFSATVPLNFGENEIRITATDASRNMGVHRFIIAREEPNNIDTIPPDVVIRSSTSLARHLTAEQITIEGTVIDDGDIAEVWVNGIEVVVSEAGTFTATIPLDFTENGIRIAATDIHGNMGTLFTLGDTEGPDIHIDSPIGSAERGFQSVGSTFVAGTVTDPSGVAEVKVNDIAVQVAGDRFEATVSLIEGNNLIRVTATDTWRNQSVEEMRVSPVPPPPPLIRKNYALLFAVDTYDYWHELRYPLVDALDIGQDLKDIYGFQVELIRNPTKTDILRVLREYAQKEYTPGDQLLIFFAGHGDFDTVTNMGYLVSQDTKKPEDDSFRMSYFSHSDFRDIIDRMSCKHIFLVMDTCYSGTFDERLAMRGEADNLQEMLSSEDIRRKLTYTTRWYLTSGAKEQVPDNSLFARALREALRSKGGRDKVLTIKEVLTYFEELSDPNPCSSEFGRNAPGSDFLFIAR